MPAAMAVALGAGLLRLGTPGLWIDEIYTARWSELPFQGLVRALSGDLHPPLYFVLERFAIRAWGGDERGLRLLSVLAGAGIVGAAGWAFRPVLGRRRAALVAIVLALMPSFLLYTRMARYYAVAALAATLSHGIYLRAVRRRTDAATWALYALSVAALLYTSYVGLCLVVAQGVALLFDRPRVALRFWLIAAAGAAALLVPWLPALAAQVRRAHALPASAVGGAPGWALMLGYDLHAVTSGETLAPWHPAGALGLLAGTWLMLEGTIAARRHRVGRWVVLPAAIALVLTWALMTLLAHATPFVALPARTLLLWPFAAVLLALGMVEPTPRRTARRIAVGALAVAWAFAAVHLYRARDYVNPIYLTPGRAVAHEILEGARPGDLVVSEDDTGVNYYLARAGYPGPVVDPIDTVATARALALPQVRRTWWVRLSRDGTARIRPAEATSRALAGWGALEERRGYLATDPTYRSVKYRLLGKPGYTHRIVLERYAASAR